MRTTRRALLITLAAVLAAPAALLPTTSATASATASATTSVAGDLAVVGNSFPFLDDHVNTVVGYKSFPAGPDVGSPTVAVDAVAHTVALTVADADRTSVLTLAWPLRPGLWTIAQNSAEPEQHAQLTRGRLACTLDGGSLNVAAVEVAPNGGVGKLLAQVRGAGCAPVLGSSGQIGAEIRVGVASPMAAPEASPAAISTGALAGTPVSHEVTVTNRGDKPWRIDAVGTAASDSWTPKFTVDPASSTCPGATLAPGEQCGVTVRTTALTYSITEQLVIAGDGEADVVVPLRLEGYNPVHVPTGAVVHPGRLNAILSWDAPTTPPGVEYRVYDVTGGARTLVAHPSRTSTSVVVPGRGPRNLQLVAANGRFAESEPVVLDVPAVSTEIVANDFYGPSVAFSEPGAGAPARERPLAGPSMVSIDRAGASWLQERNSVEVCGVDTEVCTAVPGVGQTGEADQIVEQVWLPDGRIAFTRGLDADRALWVVARDGSGLRRVGSVPYAGDLAAAPDGTQVVMRDGNSNLARMRLSDGHQTPVPNGEWVDGFTVSNSGRLVVQRRVDDTQWGGPTTITTMALDGTGVHVLPLPAGDNRSVVLDPTEKRLAFVHFDGDFDGTVWVADADGKNARQLSTRVSSWSRLQWSVDDLAAPAVTPGSLPVASPSLAWSWTATDAGGSGIASYDVRERYAPSSGDFGAYVYPAGWQGITTAKLAAKTAAGYEYCLSARARDRAGNVGAWSAERCTASPLDDAALTASSGWTRGRSTAYQSGTYTLAQKTGVSLSKTSVKGLRIGIVATTCATCGSVDVYHAGVLLGRVSLVSKATAYQQVKLLPLGITRTGTVVIKTSSTKAVAIDGIVVLH